MTIILIGGLTVLSKAMGMRVYKNSFVDMIDTTMYLNLLVFSAISIHGFKTDVTKQTAAAYTSTCVTSLLFIGAIIYHIVLLIKRDKKSAEHPSTSEPTHTGKAHVHVTHTEIKFNDRYSQPEIDTERSPPMTEELSL